MDGSRVELSPGDLVIYRGCDLAHWRETFSIKEDAWHVQGFFHYVDANGPYASYKYDGRDTVGELKPNLIKTDASLSKTNQLENNQIKSYIEYT
jgi:hypothetical protein